MYTIEYTSKWDGRTWCQGLYRGPSGREIAEMNIRLAKHGVTGKLITLS